MLSNDTYYIVMRDTPTQSLRLQLEEAIQMLRLVAAEQRTCVEIAEWLAINYPDGTEDDSGKPIVNLLLKSNKHGN